MDKIQNTDSSQNEETSVCAADDTNMDDKYSWYNYLKEHPGVLTATVSGLAAIVLASLNLVAYHQINSYLRYFAVESAYISVNAFNLYQIILSAILIVAMMWVGTYASKLYETYSQHKRKMLFVKYKIKNIQSQKREIDDKINNTETRLEGIDVTNENKDLHAKLSADLKNIRKDSDLTYSETNELKKRISKQKRACVKQLFDTFGLIVALYAYIFSFYFFEASTNWLSLIGISVAFSCICIGLLFFVEWLIHCIINLKRKQIKKDARNKESSVICDYKLEKDFPPKIFSINTKKGFTNVDISLGVISAFFFTMVLCVFFSLSSRENAEKQKDFFIVEDGETYYAVIYNNGEQLVLEKVEINKENTLIIHKNDQKVIYVADVKMEKKHFDIVQLLPEEND